MCRRFGQAGREGLKKRVGGKHGGGEKDDRYVTTRNPFLLLLLPQPPTKYYKAKIKTNVFKMLNVCLPNMFVPLPLSFQNCQMSIMSHGEYGGIERERR